MDIHVEPQPVLHRRCWLLGWGMLVALGALLCQPTPAYAQSAMPFGDAPVWLSKDNTTPTSLAWGDVDGDGDLDLSVGYRSESPLEHGIDRIYLNQDGRLETEADAPWRAPASDSTRSVAWADIDSDGDLDLGVGNDFGGSNFYRNDGLDANGKLRMIINQNLATGKTYSIAWGDADGDGDLDLAVGNLNEPNKVYRNDNGRLADLPLWTAPSSEPTYSVAWGDVDKDGDLDLAMGNNGASSKVYRNDGVQGGLLQLSQLWESGVADQTTSVAWGDVDGDDRLDLAVGNNGPEKVYRNTGGTLQTAQTNPWQSAGSSSTVMVAWGDVDGDGDLDLVAGNRFADHQIFLNQGTSLDPNGSGATGNTSDDGKAIALGDVDGDGDLDLALGIAGASSRLYLNAGNAWQRIAAAETGTLTSVAWGDVDGDGDLDLALGKRGGPNTILRNNNDQLQTPSAWTAGVNEQTTSLAWGDLNGDGELDLAVGNENGPLKVYLNQPGSAALLQTAADNPWQTANNQPVQSVAWGDMDGDGDLDLAVGNHEQPNRVYGNDNGVLNPTPIWQAAVADRTYSVAWGDMDGDGDLDLAVGNRYGYNKVYRNNGATLETTPVWTAAVFAITHSVAWGDMDGDGDLDLAVGNNTAQANEIYRNLGGQLETSASWTSQDFSETWAVAWGDADSDGDLDLVAANDGSSIIYINQLGELQRLGQSLPASSSRSIAWGDVDGDGDFDLATTYSSQYSLFLNQRTAHLHYPKRTPESIDLQVDRAPVNFYGSTKIYGAGVIPITYTLFHPASLPVEKVRGFYSLDGGGRWYTATATIDTVTQNLATAPYPTRTASNTYLFQWDVYASGFFGKSDNVIFRLEAIPTRKPVVNQVAGPFQRAMIAAQTFPLRVRGIQVRVVDNSSGTPKFSAGALVYHLPVGQVTGAKLITDYTGAAYRTNNQGYQQGRSQIKEGDRLVALAPITATESYSLYYMSAAPTLSGLNVYTATSAGVQTLTVSSANPLLLFNLDVALEWDARQDTAFLEQLKFDLRRTAEFLFDATDGQAALGEITLYHNKENWDRADIRIYASNALIPNADPGGIVRSEVSEIIAIGATTPYSITYQPGRIRIGAVWNRFGEATGTLGEDWPRTLAHELGHYAFYLYDNYLGLKAGVVVPVDTCIGTLMTDQYREDFSEFRTAANWEKDCGQTISAQRSGRADWQTITRFYPWLNLPSGQPNPGPATLPLAVTQVESRFAPTPTLPIDVAVFDLVNATGAAQVSSPHAQAVLYSQERLIDLGHPVVDKLEARGAHVGDRLCVYDLLEQRLGCETVAANDNFLTLAPKPGWQPEIVVSPVTSRTVSVLVSNVAAELPLKGKLYPENSPATGENSFVTVGTAYTTTFQLSSGVLAGHIQIWVEEAASPANPRRESLTSYALGGSPGKLKKPPKGNKRSLDLSEQSGSQEATPAIAPDGQVLIYGNVSFNDGEFYALQKVNRLPAAPLWTTVVGDGYRILKSAKAPDLVNTSILFRYRGQDVPAGEENFLSLYFWNEPAKRWDKLPTVLNRAVNEASAQAPGPGLYVLMSSLEIPLRQTGWNLVAYPVQETRPITAALASITGTYALVYGYVVTDTVDPWKVYDPQPQVPAYVNDLKQLVFGQGYWINTTKIITWLVKGPDEQAVQAANSLSLPPATYYGVLFPAPGFVPVAGLPVQALINGAVCGSGTTQSVDGQIVYTLNVIGDGSLGGACVGAGQRVQFTVAGTPVGAAGWQNQTLQLLNLGGVHPLYLPVVFK